MGARFTSIKQALIEQLHNGELVMGSKTPSENQLAQQYNVSRMTARRALTELVNEGYLLRVQGAGTFVADSRPVGSMFAVRAIDTEIVERGQQYHAVVHSQTLIRANADQAGLLAVELDSDLYQLEVVHFADNTPLQFEQRLILPAWASGFLDEDFTAQTASAYLTAQAPLTEADTLVEAVLPSETVVEALLISPSEPCLKVSRRTYSTQGLVSFACLFHPGSRYRLGGHLAF